MTNITGSIFFDLRLIPTSESVHTSSVMLADLDIVGEDVRISLLSYIEAEILRFIGTSGDDGHFLLTIYPVVGEFLHYSFAVLADLKMWV